MSTTQTEVAGAIARSISHDEIVTVKVESIADAYAELTAECDAEGSADTLGGYDGDKPLREVWGTTDDGDEWRVHLLQA